MKQFSYSHRPSDVFPPHVCELFMGYRIHGNEPKPEMLSSASVHKFMQGVYGEDWQYQESFYVLLLNRKNHLFAYKLISTGSISGTVVDPKMIFQSALMSHAAGIMLVHNHPSGVIKPSDQDIRLTKQLVSGGKLLEIHVLDHIIFAGDKYYSFADEGML